jgi:hypothetical protein
MDEGEGGREALFSLTSLQPIKILHTNYPLFIFQQLFFFIILQYTKSQNSALYLENK